MLVLNCKAASAAGLAVPQPAVPVLAALDTLAGAAGLNENARVEPGVIGLVEKADTPIVADLGDQCKASATLRARFALLGFALHELTDGSLLATRWNLCRPLPDATAALRFLRQIGSAA